MTAEVIAEVTTYHYRCNNCMSEFISGNIIYCPFCGSSLRQLGKAQYTPREYVAVGWNVIAFKSKAGFVVKDVVASAVMDVVGGGG